MADRVITGVTGSYPCREAHSILSGGNRGLSRPIRRRWLAKQHFAGQAERPTIQLDVKIPWMMSARFVIAYTSLDVLDARQSCTGVLVGCVAQPHGSGLLAPQPPGPLFANAHCPQR